MNRNDRSQEQWTVTIGDTTTEHIGATAARDAVRAFAAGKDDIFAQVSCVDMMSGVDDPRGWGPVDIGGTPVSARCVSRNPVEVW
jgi:hypothetical protein